MPIQKKPITKLELAVISSLSESYTLLPFMIFSSLLAAEASTVNFFVPVVILYSIERACIIGLRGFGEIKNPYRIMKGGIYMVIDKKRIKNPYLLAYLKAFNIKDGEEIKNYNFMFWIDKKHSEYRNIHNMPDHIMLNDEQVKDFCAFIGL